MAEKVPAKRKAGRPPGAKTVFNADKHCGARTKHNNGAPCTRVKGFGTKHPGAGRCKFHGGSTPIKHGLYSKVERSKSTARFLDLVEQLTAEGDPLNMLPDLIALRARMIVLQENEAKDNEALRDWHESYTGKFRKEMATLRAAMKAKDPDQLGAALRRLQEILDEMPPKPARLWNPYDFTKAVNSMAALVGRITEQRERQQVPMKAIIDLQEKMVLVMMMQLRKHFASSPGKGDKLAEKIAEAWRSINIEY